MDTRIEKLKLYFNFNINGKTIKKTIEGIVIKIVLNDKSTTFCISLVSYNNQINASKEVRGTDKIIAAANVYFFAISDTTTIIKALNTVLTIKYISIK